MSWSRIIFLYLLLFAFAPGAKASGDDTTVAATPVQPIDTGEYNYPFVENIICPGCCGGKQQTFGPAFSTPPVAYHMQVFDRWGNSVFETTDHTKHWDGKNGEMVLNEDVYVWKINVVLEPGEAEKQFVGHVTLIK